MLRKKSRSLIERYSGIDPLCADVLRGPCGTSAQRCPLGQFSMTQTVLYPSRS